MAVSTAVMYDFDSTQNTKSVRINERLAVAACSAEGMARGRERESVLHSGRG